MYQCPIFRYKEDIRENLIYWNRFETSENPVVVGILLDLSTLIFLIDLPDLG